MKTLYRYYLCFLAVILPLKFCTVQGNAEQPNFPMTLAQWLIYTCLPNYFLIALCGIALIGAGLLYKFPKRWIPVMPWLFCFLAGLWSLFNCTELEYARHWLEHFAGATNLCAAVWIALHGDEKLAPALARTFGVMGLICVIHGWYQHFIGLEENRRFTMEQVAKGAMQITATLSEKLKQTRIYGTFADPNVYAANLLFCAPFSLLLSYRLGQRFEKPKAGSIVAVAICALLYICALIWSGSRGGAIGAMAGLCLATCCIPAIRNTKWRLLMPAGAILLAVLLTLAVSLNKSRGGLSTASARLNYYQVAVRMFIQHPVCGVGMGEFFPNYMMLKPIEAEITREPHCLPLSLLSQCGIAGGLAALAFYLLPWFLIFLRKKGIAADTPLTMAGAIGVCAWSVHSLFQFNELIPGTAYQVAMGFAIMVPTGTVLAGIWYKIIPLLTGICMFLPLRYVKAEYYLQANEKMPDLLSSLYESMPYSIIAPRMVCDANLYKMEPFAYAKNLQKALQAAQLLIERAPHRSSCHLREAKVYFALNQRDAALKSTQNSIALAPNQAEAYVFLALLQAQLTANLNESEKITLLRNLAQTDQHLYQDENGPYIEYETKDFLIAKCLDNATLPSNTFPKNIRFIRIQK